MLARSKMYIQSAWEMRKKRDCIEWIFFLVGIMFYCGYAVYTYYECPFESFISKFYLIDLFYEGDLTFKDLLVPYAEHGQLASCILFLINVHLFNFTTFFDMAVNIFLCVIPMAVVMMFYPIKRLGIKKKGTLYYMALLLLTMCMFTCMQQGAGGMSLQVRLGLSSFTVLSVLIDIYIMSEKKSIRLYWIIILSVFLTLNFWGTAYNFAGIPVTCALLCLLFLGGIFLKRQVRFDYIGIVLAHVIAFVLYFFEYNLIGMGASEGTSTGLLSMLMTINYKELFGGLLCWCSSIFLGRYALEDGHISGNLYLAIGAMVLLLIVVAIVCYFRYKMYEKSILPVLFLGYFFVLYIELFLTRNQVAGWIWFCSSWYWVHTKVASASLIWIFLYSCDKREHAIYVDKVKMALTCVVTIGCIFLTMFGTLVNIKRLPAEKNWIDQKKQYFYVESSEEMPVDESGITPLFHPLDKSMWAIDVLKKYELSLFRD